MADLNQTQQAFVDRYAPYANLASQQLGLPSRVILAKIALETGYGEHFANNNLPGLKTGNADQNDGFGSAQTKTWEDYGGKGRTNIKDGFIKFPTPEQSIGGLVPWLSNSTYMNSLADRQGGGIFDRDPAAEASAVAALGSSGFSTDRNASAGVNRILGLLPDLSGYGIAPSFDPSVGQLMNYVPYNGATGKPNVSEGLGAFPNYDYTTGTEYQSQGELQSREKGAGLQLPAPGVGTGSGNQSNPLGAIADAFTNGLSGVAGGLSDFAGGVGSALGITPAQAADQPIPSTAGYDPRSLASGGAPDASGLGFFGGAGPSVGAGFGGSQVPSGFLPNAPVNGFGQNVNVAGGVGATNGSFGAGITPNGPAQVAAQPPQSLADMITAAYQAQLQRAPDATGLQAAYDGISSGQDTFGQFQARLASSPEAQMFRGQGVSAPMLNTATPVSAQQPQSLTDMITSAYQADLQRAPDAAGLQAAFDGISSGKETFGQFQARLAGSPEAQAARGGGINVSMLNTATPVSTQGPQSLIDMINDTYQAQLQRQGEDVAVRDEADAIGSGRDTFEAFQARTQNSPEARMLRGESVNVPMLNTAIPVAMQGPETTVGTQGPTSLADMIQGTYQAELQRGGEGQTVQGVMDDINSGRTTFDAFKAKTHDSPEARALRGEPVNAPMLDTATPILGMSPMGLPTTSLGLPSPSLPDVSGGVQNGGFGLAGITSGASGGAGGLSPFGFSSANVGGGLGAQPQSFGSMYPAGNSQGGGLDPYSFSQANVGGFDANSFGGGAPVEDFGSGAGLGPTQWNDAPSGGGAQVDAGTAGFNPEASELAFLRGQLAQQYDANAAVTASHNANINFANQGLAQANQLNAVGGANAARQFAGIQGGLGIAPVPGTSFAPAPVGIQTIGGIGPSNFGMAGLGGAPLRGFF